MVYDTRYYWLCGLHPFRLIQKMFSQHKNSHELVFMDLVYLNLLPLISYSFSFVDLGLYIYYQKFNCALSCYFP
jgi:hypothetical protein